MGEVFSNQNLRYKSKAKLMSVSLKKFCFHYSKLHTYGMALIFGSRSAEARFGDTVGSREQCKGLCFSAIPRFVHNDTMLCTAALWHTHVRAISSVVSAGTAAQSWCKWGRTCHDHQE